MPGRRPQEGIMKIRILIPATGIILGLALAGPGCQKPYQVDTAAATQTLMEMEGQAWAAVRDKQGDLFRSLFRDDGLIVSSWLTQDMNQKVEQINNPKFALSEYELSDMKVTFPSRNNAIVNYKATYKYVWDGQEFPATVNSASVWVNQERRWLAILHTESVFVND
jgi:hypothetical protein